MPKERIGRRYRAGAGLEYVRPEGEVRWKTCREHNRQHHQTSPTRNRIHPAGS
jgi:hypothetical protein